MKIKVFILAIFIGFAFQINAQNAIDNSFFAKADGFFKKNVTNGLVKYSQLKNDSELSGLINNIENANISDLSANEKQAFYINAYNLLVINAVVENYPTKSVMSISGFFDAKKRKIAGDNLTLNQIEKEKLLKVGSE